VRALCFIFAFGLLAAAARAQTPTSQRIDALNNLQEEFTACGVYYRATIACATPEWKAKLQTQLDPILKLFDAMAVSIGSSIGMTQDAIEQGLRRNADQQTRLANGNVCINIDSLYARYNARCKQLAEHPEATMDEYMRGTTK
jgi:hypothetical protein